MLPVKHIRALKFYRSAQIRAFDDWMTLLMADSLIFVACFTLEIIFGNIWMFSGTNIRNWEKLENLWTFNPSILFKKQFQTCFANMYIEQNIFAKCKRKFYVSDRVAEKTCLIIQHQTRVNVFQTIRVVYKLFHHLLTFHKSHSSREDIKNIGMHSKFCQYLLLSTALMYKC